MERLPGITLRSEMASGPMPPGRVVMVVCEMLTALRAAHCHGVLHRDIKPSNVLLLDDGHTKLTDFGIAKGLNQGRPLPTNTDETMTGVVLGTPGYLAPERAAGLPASVQSDLYSVGAVMVEALTGTRVVAGTDLPSGLPSGLHRIAGRATAVDPKDRFESADAMLDALWPLSNPSGVPTRISLPPAAPAPPATSTTKRTVTAPRTAPVRIARTAALTNRPASASRRRRKLWTALALTGAAGCALIASLFVLLEGGAQTTGRGVPSSGARVASTPTVATTSTTTTTTTTTMATTTTAPKQHHGNSLLHQLHEEQHNGTVASGSHGHGGGHGGRG
jgi:serine/threonine-protein kinase